MKNLTIHAAPLQGITDYIWRNTHNEIFGGIDLYHVPFMRVEKGTIRQRDINDVTPLNNSAPIIPQIIACKPEEACIMVDELQAMNYEEVELNFGCPHPPLGKKHKGSGMMAFPHEIENLAKALSQYSHIQFSIKMRLGWDNPFQWKECLNAFSQLSPKYITIHPRIGTQQYKGELNMTEFEKFLSECKYPVIFNGEIKGHDDIEGICCSYPSISGIMIGRGLIANPTIISKIDIVSENYSRFHEVLLKGALSRFLGGEHQVLSHMKALWAYFLPQADKRMRKAILKSHNIKQYRQACNELFGKMNNSQATL